MPFVPPTDIPIQYRQYQPEFDEAVSRVLRSGVFIGGEEVRNFETQLENFLRIRHVISCANGTDALQLALMALDLPRGSRVIVPAFTYIATVEAIRVLGLEPVFCEVDAETFNCTADTIGAVYTPDVKVLLPVHLFGQMADINGIVAWAAQHHCLVIEDNAQSIAADRDLSDRTSILTTSFFPSKNLGAFGDGGAVLVNDDALAEKIRQLANHGQGKIKYHHEFVGINSRLDALQAAVLQVKLKHLEEFIAKRQQAARYYDEALAGLDSVHLPKRSGTHSFHQYTLRVSENRRDGLKQYLHEKGIPSVIYYPVPAHRQTPYRDNTASLPVTEQLCREVLSLPMHTALDEATLSYICETIHAYFR